MPKETLDAAKAVWTKYERFQARDVQTLAEAVEACRENFDKSNAAGSEYRIEISTMDSNERLVVEMRFTRTKVVWEGTEEELAREDDDD